MKKLVGTAMIFLAAMLSFTLFAQSNYYWSDGQKHQLTPDYENYILFGDEAAMTSLEALKTSLVSDPAIQDLVTFRTKGFGIVRLRSSIPSDKIISTLKLSNNEGVQIAPAVLLKDGFRMWPTPKVVYKLKKETDLFEIEAILKKYKSYAVPGLNAVYRTRGNTLQDVYALSNALYESGLVEFAHPDFYAPPTLYNDPLYPEQFQMNNTGQVIDGVAGMNDIDIDAPEAWGITTGSSGVKVAVIDDGVEDHEDLKDSNGNSRIVGGFTPVNNGNGAPNSSGAHGEAVTGIIAASHNNLGVKGVAPLVQLLTVNIFQGGETTQDIADGITWAKDNGADVMSNSWGYTSCTVSYSNITNAIADATNNGRGGKGCVIVFASGNGYKSCVDYPANLDDVVAVGAVTSIGNRSDYSNYGSVLDIVAPSNAAPGETGAGVRTTDRMGAPGYNSGNYTSTFGGTSAACPVVSGVAALLISHDGTLTEQQVKDAIYNNADDMGPAGFDNEYANGRVNAYAALNALGGGGATCSDGIQNGQETGVDCGGPDCPPCSSGCTDNEVTLTIVLDNYPEETSWELRTDGGSLVSSGGTYGNQADGSTVTENFCLADGCYTFTIFDSYGDGICCAYGNGSYTLSEDANSNVLASGGAFGSSEATDFCLGGSGADTQAPTTPTNLTASNTTQTSTDLNWSASSDNVGVTGYNIYVDGVLNGTSSSTNYNVSGLSANTTYTMAVSAYDAAGNASGTTSINVTTQSTGGGGSTVIFADYFETGWDGWIDGGSDCYRYRGSRSWEGDYSIRIRDNSGTRSAMTSSPYDISSYSSVEIEFYFYPNSMEFGEDFWLRYHDGSGWQTVATYASGTSFNNNSFYVATVTLDNANYNFPTNAKFRFQCDASSNADRIYIDAVTLTGYNNTNFASSENRIRKLHDFIELSDLGTEQDMILSPNPTSSILHIRTEDDIQRIQIFDVRGRQVLRTTATDYIHVQSLSPGVYFVRVTTDEEVLEDRFVKQ